MVDKVETSTKIETEAKFVIHDAETFAALKDTKELGDFEVEARGTKTVVDHYLDAPRREIFRAGYACRLRASDTSAKSVVSLKALTSAEGHLHRREELEVMVETAERADWPESEIKERVGQMVGDQPLHTLFTIHQKRHQYHLRRDGQAVIELSLDEVSQDDGQVDYYELEAELLEAGSEDDLAACVSALQQGWALPAQTQSKFERALAAQSLPDRLFIQLADAERTTLEKIAGLDDYLLAKRAQIILLSNGTRQPTDIAKIVELTTRTVKKWQQTFAEKRLGIFPDGLFSEETEQPEPDPAIDSAESVTAVSVGDTPGESQEKTTAAATKKKPKKKSKQKPQSKKRKAKKQKPAVNYKQKSIGLEPTDSLAEAGRKVLGYHFARMLKNEPGTRVGEDIEALHDMRVATRRMRSALRVFGAGFTKKARKPLRQGLKATARALGPVRDLDVMVAQLTAYQETLPEVEQAGLQPLLEIWQKKRAKARKKMLKYLDSKAYRQFTQTFLEFVKTEGLGAVPLPESVPPVPYQLRHIVPGLVYTYYEEVRAYETILETAPVETLHQLRISFKGLRYTLEYLEEVLGEEKEMLIAEVKRMQDHLGDMNDADVAAGILQNFLEDWEAHQLDRPLAERSSPTPVVEYLNRTLEKRHQLLVSFPEAWANFNRPEIRHNLALAISVL